MTISDIYDVKLSRKAKYDLKKVPWCIASKFYVWMHAVGHQGLYETMKVRGYHDEPLKGKRLGQRSIRLNKAYRAFYVIKHEMVRFIEVVGVNKHGY